MHETDRAYLAGIFDGEGSIGINRSKNAQQYIYYAPNITMSTTTLELIDWIKTKLPSMGNYYLIRRSGQKDLYRWQIGNKESVRKLLELIEPYLIIKKYRAQTVLRFLEASSIEDKEHLYSSIRDKTEKKSKMIASPDLGTYSIYK